MVSHLDGVKRPKLVTYWLGELKRPWTEVTLSEEHQDYKWLGLEEACRMAKFPDLQTALKDCEAKIKAMDK